MPKFAAVLVELEVVYLGNASLAQLARARDL